MTAVLLGQALPVMVVLMRSAGIPARVVTGYQGGEYNPVGDYWLIRQSDAHAWAEVWLPNGGWERVDPTAAVAPDPVLRAWRDYCRRLARRDIRRLPGEGPLDFSRRTIAARPELAVQVKAITGLYIRLRYGNPANPAPGIGLLQRLVRRFPRAGG